MARGITSTEKGNRLERKVRVYYEALGFQVTSDVLLEGHQIDLVARRHIPGVGDLCIAIEAKARAGTLGVNDITAFVNVAQKLFSAGTINGAVIVTDGAVSRMARESKGKIVVIKSIDELESDILNSSDSLMKLIRDYEASPIFKRYYPLKSKGKTEVYSDTVGHAVEWASHDTSLLIILGDFGSGKSTVIDRVFYEVSQRRLNGNSKLFPVMLRLKNLRQYPDVWSYIEASLRDNQYISSSKGAFKAHLEAGTLLVLLDGFDEIYTGATAEDRAGFLYALSPILNSPAPCILSSRPTYFDSPSELTMSLRAMLDPPISLDRMPHSGIIPSRFVNLIQEGAVSISDWDLRNIITLLQLDDVQVTEAICKNAPQIEKTVGLSTVEFKEFLYGIYDLQDLMGRPLLLDMILRAVTTGAIDIRSRKPVGPSTLYDAYTQVSIIRDHSKSGRPQALSRDQLLSACRAIALKMLAKGHIELSAVEVANCVSAALSPSRGGPNQGGGRENVAKYISEVRTCGFLKFSKDDTLTFAHKSYLEFFVAQEVFLLGMRNVDEFLTYADVSLGREVFYFLGSFARDQKDFGALIVELSARPIVPEHRSFLHKIIAASATLLEGISLTGGIIDDVDISGAVTYNSRFIGTQLRGVRLRKFEAIQFEMVDIELSNVSFDRVKISKSTLDIACSETSFVESEFSNCSMKVAGASVHFDSCNFLQNDIYVTCEIDAVGIVVDGGMLTLGSNGVFRSLRRSEFRKVSIRCAEDRPLFEFNSGVRITNCFLSGILIRVISDGETVRRDRIDIKDCRGVVVLDLPPNYYDIGFVARLEQDNPELLVIDIESLGMNSANGSSGTNGVADSGRRKMAHRGRKGLDHVRERLENVMLRHGLEVEHLPPMLAGILRT